MINSILLAWPAKTPHADRGLICTKTKPVVYMPPIKSVEIKFNMIDWLMTTLTLIDVTVHNFDMLHNA